MLVIIKGAGDIASGIALRLFHAHFTVIMTEIAVPTAVRRTVSFSEAVIQGKAVVEDIHALLVQDEPAMQDALAAGYIPVFVDPAGKVVKRFVPDVVVDGIMAKRNLGTHIADAKVVIGVGPGFTAGIDCHAVIETMRGHRLGRVITQGSALPNTGIPGDIGGYTLERLLRAPIEGIFEPQRNIGDRIQKGELAAMVSGHPMYAKVGGIVRGILPHGIPVTRGMKVGDVDPRCEESHCFTVSDKALSVAGGVLEAILCFTQGRGN
ncbi:MAG: EF2563 family selenium-dependent molybdenum hydroxylase system protein [Treponema sp.]|jgi:xanthine dehydrogenase accessory factor|nr:EF2563 family selenium-dependent molybdenum hydroxylase system protein [Treponema sp.]